MPNRPLQLDPEPHPIADGSKSTVHSVLKALDILDCFAAASHDLSVGELVEMTGLNKATCHRLVATMVRGGWLVRTPDAAYRPTLKAFRVGAMALGRLDLHDQCHDLLRDLAHTHGHTGYLMVPDGPRAVCLDKVEGRNPVKVNVVDVGSSLPLNAGAAPRAILAFREDLLAELSEESLGQFTANTPTTMAALLDALEEIRRVGYSFSVEDIVRGVSAVGAPVRDAEGVVVAAISLGGLATGFEPPRREEIVAAVIEAGRIASERLGFA